MAAKPISNVAVVLGTMTIGAPDDHGMVRITTHEGVAELLDVFQKHGHCQVDTARIYGGGTTEEYLEAGKNLGFFFSEELSHSPADLRKALNDSLEALKTDKLSILYLHAPDRSTPFEDTLREVNNIYAEAVFERFGLSNFMSWEVAQICEICKRNGWVMPTVYEGLYNILQRQIEAELIPCLRAYGISLYVYNPLAGGFLTSHYKRDQTLLRPVLAPHGIAESAAALRWLAHHSVLKKKCGDAIIVGAGSVAHLEQNLQALDEGPLPEDVVTSLDAGWEHTRALPSSAESAFPSCTGSDPRVLKTQSTSDVAYSAHPYESLTTGDESTCNL
ncbi:NADP-dependent oxidoreductase domain-containing protein [Mycena latifolia]|nr:NADP-dependent oxidoreductase domain-containing protein [Mycena latifolia]